MSFEEYALDKIRELEKRVATLETIDDVPVACVASLTSNQTGVTTGTQTIVNFNNTDYDTHSGAGTDGSGKWQYTVPVGGWYTVNAAIDLLTDTGWAMGEDARCRLLVDAALWKDLDLARDIASGGSPGLGNGMSLPLTKGQTVQIALVQNSGATLTINGNTAGPNSEGTITWVSIIRQRGY